MEFEPIGKKTTISSVTYWNAPCANKEPHPQHFVGSSGGGGAAGFTGVPQGDREVNIGNVDEYWCMGVRGMMQV